MLKGARSCVVHAASCTVEENARALISRNFGGWGSGVRSVCGDMLSNLSWSQPLALRLDPVTSCAADHGLTPVEEALGAYIVAFLGHELVVWDRDWHRRQWGAPAPDLAATRDKIIWPLNQRGEIG